MVVLAELIEDLRKVFPGRGLEMKALALPNQEVTAVTSDSRQTGPGSIFVAIRGGSSDGHQFVPRALAQGAALAIGEMDLAFPAYIKVPDSRLALARLAASFHGSPTHRMLAVGVTGTSGKTTTTYLLESILREAGRKVGVIGTVSFRFGEKVYPSTHTTPGPVELQGLLAEMERDGCDAVVMEVSSHALKQHRAAFIAFDAMVFTNLSPEHLDYHTDMEDYFQAKALLFTDYARTAIEAGKKPVLVSNLDDPYGKRLHDGLAARREPGSKVMGYRFDPSIRVSLSGIECDAGPLRFHSPLTGKFNAMNILAAGTATLGMGIAETAIRQGIAGLSSPPGRLERISGGPNGKGLHVFVDYAHKPDALENVLRTLKEVKGTHRLITIFGCGGDRDRTKRPVMARISAEHSDHTVVTSDNPRTEDPQAIIDEVVSGMPEKASFQIESDRRAAIVLALRMARSGDVVLIAGKGHEDYQILSDGKGGTRKIHFDDREIAREFLDTAF